MDNLSDVTAEKDAYLILSWICDSCDLEIENSIKKLGPYNTLKLIKNKKYLNRLKNIESLKILKKQLDLTEIHYISQIDSKWPAQLNDLNNLVPLGLFYRGKIEYLINKSIAIVGTRKSSSEGNMISTEIAFDLANKNFNVVSGGAIGIDHAAHHGALVANGITVSIQASGLNKLYPSKNIDLFQNIAKTGLLLSEYPPDRGATKINFLHRNRLIAAIASATLVIEAGEISGALSTARYATKLNRNLMAFPGSIFSKSSQGTNELIRNREAELVSELNHVLQIISPIGVNS